MGEVIVSAIGVILGLFIIGKAVYDRNFRNYIPDPKKWGRTRAKVTGRHHYRTKNTKRYGPAYYDHYEKSIVYTVDGVNYKKFVNDSENGSVHIYYRLDNPNIIKTVSEIKRKKCEGKSTVYLISMIAGGVIVMSIAVPFLVMGIAKVTHTPIGNTYYL